MLNIFKVWKIKTIYIMFLQVFSFLHSSLDYLIGVGHNDSLESI